MSISLKGEMCVHWRTGEYCARMEWAAKSERIQQVAKKIGLESGRFMNNFEFRCIGILGATAARSELGEHRCVGAANNGQHMECVGVLRTRRQACRPGRCI